MSTPRVNIVPKGKEGVISVKKSGSYVPCGSITTIGYGRTKGTTNYACREGKAKGYDDSDDTTVQLNGLVFYRASGDLANNFDAVDFEDAMANETELEIKLTSGKEGDRIRESLVLVTSFNESHEQSGFQTYDATLEVVDKPTVSAEPVV